MSEKSDSGMPPGDMPGMPPGGMPGMSADEIKNIGKAVMPKERKPTPEEEKYLGMVRKLTELSTTLVIKVATCKCKTKDNCKIFLHGVKIAEVMDELQEAKPDIEKISKMKSGKSGKSRTGV